MSTFAISKLCKLIFFKWPTIQDATKLCTGKDSFKVQPRPMDFNVTESEHFTDGFLDSSLQLHLWGFSAAGKIGTIISEGY